MSEHEQRAALIASAARLFQTCGYAGTGTRQVAAGAGVPPGSFTNHFRSKEVLAGAALEAHSARLRAIMRDTLGDRSRTPHERLDAYFDLVGRELAELEWREGCMIPDFAAEVGAQSDHLRGCLLAIMHEQVGTFAEVIADLARIPATDPAAYDLASFVIAAWHGTLLRVKVEQSAEPVHRFRRVLRRVLESVAEPRPQVRAVTTGAGRARRMKT